ncbi:MAG: stage II sporulation protein M [bacterium]|nr:stage II sporulation protein M [bacterium]
MKQEAFVREREERWHAFETALLGLEAREPAAADFAGAYRAICQDLALARERGFGTGLVGRLEGFAMRGHQQLYGARPQKGLRWLEGLLAFPAALRREWKLLAATALLFYGTGAISYVAVRINPDVVYSVAGAETATNIEQMYDPDAPHMGAPRETSGDLAAFGHYISNNVSIGFRCFASGILFGLGSIFLVGFNGVLLGGVAGHIVNIGYGETFWPFVIGHGAFELNAIVVCGMCGLRIGLAVTVPGRRKRGDALRTAARGVLPLLYGGTAMLVIAAVIEAFWSSNHDVWPTPLLYAVGTGLWVFVLASLLFAGPRRAS